MKFNVVPWSFIIHYIVYLCNLRLSTGVFPTSLKTEIVQSIPNIPKGDFKPEMNNDRPIFILSIFS